MGAPRYDHRTGMMDESAQPEIVLRPCGCEWPMLIPQTHSMYAWYRNRLEQQPCRRHKRPVARRRVYGIVRRMT